MTWVTREALYYAMSSRYIQITAIGQAKRWLEGEYPGRCGWMRFLNYRTMPETDYDRANNYIRLRCELAAQILPVTFGYATPPITPM